MRELGIARVLAEKRREKGITQDELAEIVGVSKASVSKWETGQSYPDITFLPVIAAYFNITVDALIGYAPQMEKGEIRALYRRFAGEFAEQPFDEVMGRVRDAVHKHFSCWSLLHQMAVLIVNHHMLAKDAAERETLLREAEGLCARVRAESGDVRLAHEAARMEAVCTLSRGEADAVFALLGEESPALASDDMLIAQAHGIRGDAAKARAVLQIGIFQHMMMLVGAMPGYLMLSLGDEARCDEIVRRTRAVAEAFQLDALNSNAMAQFYFAAAQAYCALGRADEAVGMLARYADVCANGRFSYTLHGDAFFDALDGWFEQFDLGTDAPRSKRLIRESMYEAVANNPAFGMLAERPDFQEIIGRLKQNMEG